MDELQIAKRGEQIFSLSFRRLAGRVKVIIKTHPSLEALLKSWGSGISSSIFDFGGREWIFESGQLPDVWDLRGDMTGNISYGTGYYTLSKPGFPLFEDLGPTTDRHGNLINASPAGGLINISFLRIVGISGGIEFELPGVYSVTHLKDLQARIQSAVKRLYVDYLLPLDLTVQMNTQETRL